MNDEITAIGEIAELAAPRLPFHVQLSATRRGARLARLLAVEQLRAWGLPYEDVAQVVAELAANAATHGRVPGRDIRLGMAHRAGVLRVEVTDTRCDRLPGVVRQEPGAMESGYGLVLVGALADRWGVVPGLPPRKVVWAEFDTR